MEILRYLDTRGCEARRPAFSEVLIEGIADGGGLYVPESLPHLALDRITSLSTLPYHDRAADIFSLFGVDVPSAKVSALMGEAYGENFDDPRIAPIAEPLPGMHLLELWHGPTAAFKDMALQCMPVFFSEAVAVRRAEGKKEEYLILVATSGDTGKAALAGYAGRAHTRIAVFYPADGVSEMQRRQMVTQRGDNVAVFGIRGNFDDCQNAVKAAFRDEDFAGELYERMRIRLSSANSINWGRLLPQVVYYVSAYADLVEGKAVKAGDPIDVCVPTGNFGNILAAWYAKRIGTPIDRLICASNENNVLTDFIESGRYDVSRRPFVKTPSPSMDILVSSNLERLLFEIRRDGDSVRGWVEDLHRQGSFEVDEETFRGVRADFTGDYVTNDRSLETIRDLFMESGYLLDPHSAVAWEVARRKKDKAPVLVVATAHWSKFGADTYRALAGLRNGEQLPEKIRKLSPGSLLEKVRGMASGESVPASLADLDRLPERFSAVVEGSRDGVEYALRSWLEGPSRGLGQRQ